MSFRKEKKYRLSKSDFHILKSNLASIGMKPLYNKRQINSIYFDNRDMQMFYESEEGVLPRKKIRVRWYDTSTKFSKEIKISSIEGRFKSSQKLISINDFSSVSRIKFFDSNYGHVFPMVQISYLRTYFELDGMRITFDENISYKDLRKANNNSISDTELVVEVKIPESFEDDSLEKIIPYQTARFSKFCRGILVTGLT